MDNCKNARVVPICPVNTNVDVMRQVEEYVSKHVPNIYSDSLTLFQRVSTELKQRHKYVSLFHMQGRCIDDQLLKVFALAVIATLFFFIIAFTLDIDVSILMNCLCLLFVVS